MNFRLLLCHSDASTLLGSSAWIMLQPVKIYFQVKIDLGSAPALCQGLKPCRNYVVLTVALVWPKLAMAVWPLVLGGNLEVIPSGGKGVQT